MGERAHLSAQLGNTATPHRRVNTCWSPTHKKRAKFWFCSPLHLILISLNAHDHPLRRPCSPRTHSPYLRQQKDELIARQRSHAAVSGLYPASSRLRWFTGVLCGESCHPFPSTVRPRPRTTTVWSQSATSSMPSSLNFLEA